ncbi:MAG: hypothetical protein RI911_583 [Candidatus Parcubacteria bacterium]|jgi:hypothetical protein
MSTLVKLVCVCVALFCVGWYVRTYQPEVIDIIFTPGFLSEKKQNNLDTKPVAEDEPRYQQGLRIRPDQFSWIFTEEAYNESLSMPQTAVALKYSCTDNSCEPGTIPLGTYQGLCSVIETPESKNQLTGVLCWFAGAGDEISVFEEEGRYIIKHGEIAEPTAESNAFRGNFTVIKEF